MAMERQRGEDGQLVGCVVALHIRRGIRFRQAQALRVGEHVGIRRALPAHPAEDVVGRAVDDAHHRSDAVGLQRIVHRADDRDRAADARLVVKARAILARRRHDLLPVRCERHLVGCHDGLPVFERRRHVGGRRLLAAHEFHDHVDLRIAKHVLRLIREKLRGDIPASLLAG